MDIFGIFFLICIVITLPISIAGAMYHQKGREDEEDM